MTQISQVCKTKCKLKCKLKTVRKLYKPRISPGLSPCRYTVTWIFFFLPNSVSVCGMKLVGFSIFCEA